MVDHWKEQLLRLQEEMEKEQRKKIFEEGKFKEVLEGLLLPKTDEEQALATQCHYQLMKEACAEGNIEDACYHTKKVLRSPFSSRAVRSLTQDRLALLGSGLPTYNDAPLMHLVPGILDIDPILQVPVLGIYGTWGRKGDLNDLIQLLKKAPEELDSREERTRPLSINMIGYKLFELLSSRRLLHRVDLILPIPADPERYATRGYNQQGEIAKALSLFSHVPMYTDVLQKTRSTRSVHTLSTPAERMSELKGSMRVAGNKSHLIEERTVLLIDDVVTYGTHFKEARRVLLEAGSRAVLACALASARVYTPLV